MDTILFFMLSVAFVIFRFFLQFGYAGSQLQFVGYSSLTMNQSGLPALGVQSRSTRTTYMFSLFKIVS
jgi:hypothetical protein